ncbi:MAG: T9SS type A sorting domain-containing protein, partial [Bacteroidetes bacterium]|nr:T9SS type A sorting domain-containing protein [Bacteroidota bacterium]
TGANANMLMTSTGTDTVIMRIDADTDIDGQAEVSYPVDVIGVATQYTSAATVYFGGYQIQPRYYATDFISPASVTFKVNMKVKILEGAFNRAEDLLYVRGTFNSWGTTNQMTDADGDSIYTVTVSNIGSGGTQIEFKFMYVDVSATQDRWESDPGRLYTLLDGAQEVDGGYFDRDDKVSKNISMYFSCNMELEKLSGRFDPARDTVSVNGSFQGWTPKANRLIPNPLNVDIYEGTFTILGAETESIEFKYWYTPNNWESVANRTYTFTAGDVTSGTATYTGNFNNGTLETVLNQPATLKLTVYVPPTSVSAVNGQPFPAIKTVHAAGSALPLKWPAGGWPDADSVNMVKLYDDGTHGDQTAGDKIFTNSITFAAYTVLRVEYKYGVNFGDAANNGGGNDNEQGFGSNHVLQMHRFLGSATVVDTFAAMRDPSWLKDIVLVGVEDEIEIPKVYSLSQNYPNPFNPTTTIQFGLPKESAVTLMIYNILGEQVATLINNETLNAGEYNYDFNASRLASGTYIYRLTAGEFSQTKKMILLK